MLYHGLEALAPHTTQCTRSTGAAADVDIARCVRIMTNADRGFFSAEYEESGDGVEGRARSWKK